MSILEDLFNGKITPWERQIGEEKAYLLSRLSVDDAKRFERYETLMTESANYSEVNAHSRGFILGMNLMLEVMQRTNEVVN
ncbi:MAG: hypothetical protein R3Y53_09890 [Bacillota bacterium]